MIVLELSCVYSVCMLVCVGADTIYVRCGIWNAAARSNDFMGIIVGMNLGGVDNRWMVR